jgi:hypothetical protein
MTKADVKKKNPLIPMVAGCIAGGIEATAVWPMECKFSMMFSLISNMISIVNAGVIGYSNLKIKSCLLSFITNYCWLFYCLDIKTQLQLTSRAATPLGLKPLPYTGMISGLTYTVRTTGFFSLYR